MLRFDSAGRSEVGLVRGNNEDSGFAGPSLLLVADGVGGAAAGEVASATAAYVTSALAMADPEADVLDLLERAARLVHDQLRVGTDQTVPRMGTTWTALLTDGRRVALGHVGDSRAYRLRDGELVQVTDEGMLDLIDHLTRWVRAPLLLVCLTRDELLERRPGWGGGRRNATTISLEPLTENETRELVAALMPGSDNGSADVVPQVAERSGGNPLFAEEMVNRLLEEETAEAQALPRTVQSLLAARLDSLERLERRLLQSASVVGQTFWEGALTATAAEEGLDLSQTLANLEEKDLLVPSAGSRLAGEREYAFKHVLIRDVAYSMLPKSVRCRKHVEVAEFIRDRAGERSDGVIGLIAEHFARAAALGSEAGLDREALAGLQSRALESLEAAGDAAAALYSNAEAFDRYTAALEISESLDPGTLARIGEKQGDVALRLGRVDAAVAVWERGLELPPGRGGPCPGCGSPPQDRRRTLAQGRTPRIDRQLPARDRPAQGRASVHRARAPLRGGGLALHAHRRQHARDLRVREGAPTGGAAGRGPGCQSRARHLRRASSAESATRRRRARTWSARSRSPASPTGRRPSAPCSPSAITSRSPRPTTTAPPMPTGRHWRSRRRSATFPRRSSCTLRSASSPWTPQTGRRSSGPPRPAPAWPSARASTGSSASPT